MDATEEELLKVVSNHHIFCWQKSKKYLELNNIFESSFLNILE